MADGSVSRENMQSGPEVAGRLTSIAEQRGARAVAVALSRAVRNSDLVTRLFGKADSQVVSGKKDPNVLSRKGQLRRGLLTVMGTAVAGVALDLASGGNVTNSLVDPWNRPVLAQVPVGEEPVKTSVSQGAESGQEAVARLHQPAEEITVTYQPLELAVESAAEPSVFAETPPPNIPAEQKPIVAEKPAELFPKPKLEPPKELPKPVEEKGIVELASFLDPKELKRSETMRKLMDEFLEMFTFRFEIGGKKFKVPLPFAEVGEGYGFNTVPYPDGNIPSKMSPEMAQDRFRKAVESGEFVDLYHQKLEEYKSIDPKKLSPNDKLAYNNLGEDQQLGSGEKYAFYNALRDIGIYGDCNGTAYNALAFVYDKLIGNRGSFDGLTRRVFPDLNIRHPVIGFNIGRFGDSRWADTFDPPPIKELRAGDIIALGKEQHTMIVVGWDPEKKAIILMQNTDETRKVQGLDTINVYILNENLPLQQQKWEETANLADDTTLANVRGGDRYQSRLEEPIGGSGKRYKVFRNRELQKILDQKAA